MTLIDRIGGTHGYFEYAKNSSLSYIDSATSHGNAIVSYDRLGAPDLHSRGSWVGLMQYSCVGVGNSDFPDALSVVQSPVDVEILHELILHVKSDARFAKAKTFVGVGHSYGRYDFYVQSRAPRYGADYNMTPAAYN